jgi:hypothetical protein
MLTWERAREIDDIADGGGGTTARELKKALPPAGETAVS